MLHRGALPAMGTRFEIVAGGEDPLLLRAAVEQAFEEISICHRLWNVFSHQSLLARIHAEGHQRPVPIDGLTLDLLLQCARLHEETGGAFDPVIGADLAAADPRREGVDGVAPRDGFDGIDLDPVAATVRLLEPRLRFDLGAIAKGYACDLAAQILRDAAVSSALIHGGTSSVVAVGAPQGRADWAIEVKGHVGNPIRLHDHCLAVSSPAGGGGGGHIVDPGSGDRISCESPGALVIGASATDCDAWSTALTVTGFDNELVRRMPPVLKGYPLEPDPTAHKQPGAVTPVEEVRCTPIVEIS
ncbi:MAG: FAD:protein FMN transferase [Planctomycetota bacterium]|nr:FAD:protein FMN transferase [Planctomycetota bacterium]